MLNPFLILASWCRGSQPYNTALSLIGVNELLNYHTRAYAKPNQGLTSLFKPTL
jgi:hypothetical protein